MSTDPLAEDLETLAERRLVLRVPTDRAPNVDGCLNLGTHHQQVEVLIDPTIGPLGIHEPGYGRDVIRLREWNEQVLLHELLHVAVSRSAWWNDSQRQINDPNGHDVIARIEVALWETGWRRTAAHDVTTEAAR